MIETCGMKAKKKILSILAKKEKTNGIHEESKMFFSCLVGTPVHSTSGTLVLG